MANSVKNSNEPFIRVRLVRFSDGTQIESLSTIKLRVDAFDLQQMSTTRPKFPEYDAKMDRFCFETRTREGRQVTIGVYSPVKKTTYTYKTSIEDLIRHADEVIREYRFSDKGRAWMSIELIAPKNLRQAQRIPQDKIRKHYGHEFIRKYFTSLPAFCTACKKILWGFNTPGYRCQICSLVVHEQCINLVAACKQLNLSNSLSQATIAHKFSPEPNFFPQFCDHDGQVIHPLRAWKCSECGMIVHSKCRSNVAQFCGTREIAVEMYSEWKEQNQPTTYDTYLSLKSSLTNENNQSLLINIYARLQEANDRKQASEDLNLISKEYESIDNLSDNSSIYYNQSTDLLSNLTFCGKLGRGMSGSVYWVKYSGREYALKALRKHRIFEADEYNCVRTERDVLILSRQCSFINKLYAVFHDLQRVYFLLEYASCGTFYEFLLKFGMHFDQQCIQWFSGQILCALRFLHSKLIIHRDLKPENVLLMDDGQLKLADFGFCKQFQSKTETTRTYCGTAEYIAPEIYQRISYSFSVDLWSLGVMIHEMATLVTPFYHSREIEIRQHVLHGPFRPPENISIELREILIGLLQKNPQERYGIKKLQSSRFYSSSPYSLDEIEQKKCKCPWKGSIPLYPSPEKTLSNKETRLSCIDEEHLCTTLTVNKDQFRHFSFIALTE